MDDPERPVGAPMPTWGLVADFLGGFPGLFNVEVPYSVLIYPTIALVTAITVHVLLLGAASLAG